MNIDMEESDVIPLQMYDSLEYSTDTIDIYNYDSISNDQTDLWQHSPSKTTPMHVYNILPDSSSKKELNCLWDSQSMNFKNQPSISVNFNNAIYFGDDWDFGDMRPRVRSMPIIPTKENKLSLSHRQKYNDQKIKCFTITPKGLQKDHYRSTKSNSNTNELCSVNSTTSINNKHNNNINLSLSNFSEDMKENSTMSLCSTKSSNSLQEEELQYKILIYGRSGVGKRSLITQFISTDSTESNYSSIDDEAAQTVTILLDGEEASMQFFKAREFSEVVTTESRSDTDNPSINEADAHVIIYSVEDHWSFVSAIEFLTKLQEQLSGKDRSPACILVANKADLVRSRVVDEEEGLAIAKQFDCKYIETSTIIEHNVDDLLVGIVKQIRLLRQKHLHNHEEHRSRLSDACCLIGGSTSMILKILGSSNNTSKSCDNLYVL